MFNLTDALQNILSTNKVEKVQSTKPAKKTEDINHSNIKNNNLEIKQDKVELSFSSVLKKIDSTPEINYDKVNLIKQQIKDGTYTPKADLIASKMIQSNKEFIK